MMGEPGIPPSILTSLMKKTCRRSGRSDGDLRVIRLDGNPRLSDHERRRRPEFFKTLALVPKYLPIWLGKHCDLVEERLSTRWPKSRHSFPFAVTPTPMSSQDAPLWFRPITSRTNCLRSRKNATEQGATTVVFTSAKLCQSIAMDNRSTHACCEAMQVKQGDVVLGEQNSSSGMTVRYQLRRSRP